jgi:hypothetical protein
MKLVTAWDYLGNTSIGQKSLQNQWDIRLHNSDYREICPPNGKYKSKWQVGGLETPELCIIYKYERTVKFLFMI